MSNIKFDVSDKEMEEVVNRIYKMKDGELVEEFTFLTNHLSGEPTEEEVNTNYLLYLTLGLIQKELKKRNIQFVSINNRCSGKLMKETINYDRNKT